MTPLASRILQVYIEFHDSGVDDPEGNTYREMVATYPELTFEEFKRELGDLVRAGLLEGESQPQDPNDPGPLRPTAQAEAAAVRSTEPPNLQAN